MPGGSKWPSWADALLLLLGLLHCSRATDPLTSSCPQCVTDRQVAAQLKVEAIKKQILSKLSLHSKPNITSPPPRDAVLEALARSPDRTYLLDQPVAEPETPADDDYYARTSEIIAFAEPGSSLNGHIFLDFNQQHETPHRLRVTGGTLWVQLRYVALLPRRIQQMLRNHSVTLYVFRVTNASALHMDMIASQRLQASNVGWQRMDVHQAVQRWFSGTPGKFTLLVDCVGCDSLVELALFDSGERKTDSRRLRHRNRLLADMRPFLTIATEPVRRRRVRRHTISCGTHTTQCCKQSLYVNFRDLGWDDWIIAPKGYYANYCMGECVQRTPDTFAHFHTHVIEEYRQKNPYASITPCCAPTRLSSMSLIYFDPDMNIIKTDLPKMIVDECGCT